MNFSRLFLIVTALLAGGAHAADLVPGAKKKLDAYFDGLQSQGQVNGSIAISERGVIRYQRSIGFATIENGTPQPADIATRYRIGSVTKLFTAAMTMQLAEQASLTLDNKLAEFYPDLPNALNITYRNLLQQRSGLANYTAAPDFDSWRTTPRTHADMLGAIAAGGTHFAAGEAVEYNDTNYLLMGFVLEKVYERPYDEIVQRQVAKKLGLARTYYAGRGSASTLESISYQATPDGWRAETATDPSIDGGAGGMLSNATDLVTFIDGIFTGKLVTPYSLATMRDQEGGSGIGLWPRTIAGNNALGERGSTAAFNACVYHFPERGISIAWTSNASSVPMDEIVEAALRLVFEKSRKAPKITPAG